MSYLYSYMCFKEKLFSKNNHAKHNYKLNLTKILKIHKY